MASGTSGREESWRGHRVYYCTRSTRRDTILGSASPVICIPKIEGGERIRNDASWSARTEQGNQYHIGTKMREAKASSVRAIEPAEGGPAGAVANDFVPLSLGTAVKPRAQPGIGGPWDCSNPLALVSPFLAFFSPSHHAKTAATPPTPARSAAVCCFINFFVPDAAAAPGAAIYAHARLYGYATF
ncbi:hypothetical protein QAD02_012525 [Eretmocerus hayati]|uniref:Uncharacterized protein n=1 Tax=Eretmocerus hayati TaxID=131215 RepID=A0ACC2P0U2_9HYME|nr:hypothetical protein QAD02_012525 [Eretmocerus hayati]